tara:strand:- start:3387 stop:3659 length:273 start_codon:yes stop_codon:yes gene_type:complete
MQSILKISPNFKKKKVKWTIFRDVDSTWNNEEYDRTPYPLLEHVNSMEEARIKAKQEEFKIMEIEKKKRNLLNYRKLYKSKTLYNLKMFV